MHIDLLIQARWIITVNVSDQVLENHALAVNNGRIIDILPNVEAIDKYQPTLLKNLEQHALMPGFINAHTHAAMSLMRGIADDLALMDWLQNHIWPIELRWMSESFVKDGTDLAIAEMIKGGTTCFNDMYFFPDITARQAIKSGIRACIGLILIDFQTVWAEHADQYIEKGLTVYEELRHENLITAAFAPHAPYTVSDEPLQKIRTLADELELPIHMHVHETTTEVSEALQKNQQRPLQRLHQLQLINPQFMGVHMTQLTGNEINFYADSGAHIVHCPESNLKLASGFCPVSECLDAGINVAIGTDSAASNNNLDMLGEMRVAALLAKGVSQNPKTVPAHTALRMATINGAKALNIDDQTGSLELGKSADMIAFDLSYIETQPLYDPVAQIVYSAQREQITDVWVAGNQLLKNKNLITMDIAKIKHNTIAWQQKLGK